MRPLDWLVFSGALLLVAGYGVLQGRRQRSSEGYLLAGRTLPWWVVAISVMATQASAVTFLATPGQAYADGMRFVQFYFGLPLAIAVVCLFLAPAFHRSGVYTAYEFLERRFDGKTRTLTACLFLLSRGLATGITLYTPAAVLSVLLHWRIEWTTTLMGGVAVLYTTWGGSRAVGRTHVLQMGVILTGMGLAFAATLRLLPAEITFGDALGIARAEGKLNAIDTQFDLTNRYNVWSGVIGGFFLQLSYFGTDQSQVQRYLSGKSLSEIRRGLVFNAIVKIPMQFAILFVGVMVFVVYHFATPPVHFDPVGAARVRDEAAFRGAEEDHARALEARRAAALRFADAHRSGDAAGLDAAASDLRSAGARVEDARARAAAVVRGADPRAGSDVNFVFLRFVLETLPAGIVGLVLAAIFCASMASSASELSSLASTAAVDLYGRFRGLGRDGGALVLPTRLLTLLWGAFAVGFAQFAGRLGSLVEAVNIVGSLFYGTILGVFVVAFALPRVGGTAVCVAAIVAEALVVGLFTYSRLSFLWFNVAGCAAVVAVGLLWTLALPRRAPNPRP